MAAIQDWHQNDSYNLYMSESRGLFFTLMLENAVSSRGPEGNVMIDLYEVGSDGAAILHMLLCYSGGPGFIPAAVYRTCIFVFTTKTISSMIICAIIHSLFF